MKKGSIDDGLVYHAGFPNAAEDQRAMGLSLDKLIVQRPASTYFWRLESDIPELHWRAASIVVVDRSLPPRMGAIVVALIDEAFTLCRVRKTGFYRLDGQQVEAETRLWGVVTYVVHDVRAD